MVIYRHFTNFGRKQPLLSDKALLSFKVDQQQSALAWSKSIW